MLSFKPRVGQVIYVLIHLKEQTGLDSNLSLHPVQIVEEITKVTLTGTEKSFMCKEGSSGKIFPIEGLKGHVFENSQEASRFLSLKMKEHVEKTVLTASKLASKLFGVKDENFSTASHINDDIINSFRQFGLGATGDVLTTFFIT